LFTLQLNDAYWILLAGVVGLYWLLALLIKNSSFMKRHNITTWGPVIFLRTTRGIDLLNKLAGPKTFWRALATAGIPLVILAMAWFLALILLMTYVMIRSPPEPSSYNTPRNLLLIPGLNEYIPFVWGWIAIFVTMVVHELSHGILSRVEGIKVKSMGLAFLAAPIAAFVEPDDEELFGTPSKPAIASRGARVRILAAGVISNFIVAIIAMALFFGPVIGTIAPIDRPMIVDVQDGSSGGLAGFQRSMAVNEITGINVTDMVGLYSALIRGSGTSTVRVIYDDHLQKDLVLKGTPVKGVLIASVFNDSGASAAGVKARSILYQIDGDPTPTFAAFRGHMNSTHPGQEIEVATTSGSFKVKLGAKADGTSLIGVGISPSDALYVGGVTFQEFPASQFLDLLKAIPVSGMQGLGTLLGLPFVGVPGFTDRGFPGFSGWITNLFEPVGWAKPLRDEFFWIANLLLWIGWIDLYAGLFNCLPAVPLDGGHIFRDLVQGIFERIVGANAAARWTRTVVALLAWTILTSLLITIIAPFTHGLPG